MHPPFAKIRTLSRKRVELAQRRREIDVFARKLNIVGVKGERKTPEEMDAILAQRRARWKPKPSKYTKGVLRLFSELAASPMKEQSLEK